MDFDYVVKKQEKAKICFGSTSERKTLECDFKGLYSKHARHNMKENILTIMPGMYEISHQTSAMSSLLNRPTSILGTVLGGRTDARKYLDVASETPAPGSYDISRGITVKISYCGAPFNSRTLRKTFPISNTPGVGQYNITVLKCHSIRFAHSFGGKKTILPAVRMKCGPFNFDTCERCNKAPEGDYWILDSMEVQKSRTRKKKMDVKKEDVFLCRSCYNIEKTENKIFSKSQIRGFKKIRNCSIIHFHDGCRGKLYLVPIEEIKKLSMRESYLSQFFQ